MKVYEAVARAVAAEQEGPVFGLMGDRIIGLWGALAAQPETPLVPVRHEAAALSMADGFAQTGGGVGVVAVTSGPGLTHLASPLVAAARSHAPVVVLAGEVPPGEPHNSQRLDQARFARACEAHVETLRGAARVAEDVRAAFFTARSQRRPVVLNLPLDLQDRDLPGPWHYQPSHAFLGDPAPAPSKESVERLVAVLVAAERPLFIAGRGAVASGARGAIEALAERTGALLATTLLAKGWFDGHPFDLGIAGGFAAAPAEALMAEADLVVGFGAELGHFTAGDAKPLFAEARIVRVDIRALPERLDVLPGLHLQGDACKTALAVCARLEERRIRKTGFRTPATEARLRWTPPERPAPGDGLDPRLLMRELSPALPGDVQITIGAGHFWSFPVGYLALPPDALLRFSYGFGVIGCGVPYAIGAALATPDRPHLLIEGDGSLMQNLQELDTAVRLGLRLAVLVMNDGGFGAEVHKLTAKGMDPGLARYDSPDFVALARAFGGGGRRLEREADVGPALHEARDAGGLFVIDARISPTTPADRYERLYFGKDNRTPLLRPAR